MKFSRCLALVPILLLAACSYPDISLRTAAKPAVAVEQVKVLTKMPSNADVIGQVYGWSSVPVDSRVGYDRAVVSLRERAASIGADAVWVPPFEEVMWPRQSPYTWPDRRGDRGDQDSRPTEIMGRALDLP